MDGVKKKLGGCAATVATVCAGIGTLIGAAVFGARDFVSTYLPDQARAVGLGWLADQPRPKIATDDLDGGECQLEWRRTGPQAGWYRVTCTADPTSELVLSDFAVIAAPMGNEKGDYAYEDQRPMAGDDVTIDPGDTWTYEGTVAIGMPALSRTELTFTADVVSDGAEDELRMRSAEPP